VGAAVSACMDVVHSGGRLKEGGLAGGAHRAVAQEHGHAMGRGANGWGRRAETRGRADERGRAPTGRAHRSGGEGAQARTSGLGLVG
jgi:hypothetical protein